MIEIREIDAADKWNELVSKCVNFNIFNLHQWGEFKKSSWQVKRIAFYKKDNFIGATQLLFKQKLNFSLAWISSGIVFTNYKYLGEIVTSLEDYFKGPYVFRFNFFESSTGEVSFNFDKEQRLLKCNKSINSGYTIRFDLSQMNDTVKSMSSNNRYYYKKAIKNDLSFEEQEVNVNDFVQNHNEMTDTKKLSAIIVNDKEIQQIKDCFGESLKMFVVKDGDTLLSSCLIILHKKHAYYYLASASSEGREKFASFFMVKELIDHLKESGVKHFDFGGITPFKRSAEGVNRFKMGFGGEVINYVGERQLASSKLLSTIISYVITR